MSTSRPTDGVGGFGAALPRSLILGLAALLAGCGLSGPDDEDRDVPVAVSTTSNQALTPASRQGADSVGVSSDDGAPFPTGPGRSVTVTGVDGDSLVIDVVALMVHDGRLKPVDAEQCGGDTTCVPLQSEAGAFTIPLDGGTETQLETRVGLGLYDEISLRLVTASASDAGLPDTLSELEGASVLVRGSFNGEPFTVTRDVTGSVRFPLSPALEVTETTAGTNVTLAATVRAWYLLGDGTVLDPRQQSGRLTTGLIESSMSAYPDRDRDGEPDRSGPGSP